MLIEGSTALITGSASWLGPATARRILGKDGAPGDLAPSPKSYGST